MMGNDYKIRFEERPRDSAWGMIGRGLGAYNDEIAGDDSYKLLCYVLEGPDEAFGGGVIAQVHYNWLYVDLLWIKAELRGQGYGKQLMLKLEAAAREAGAKKAYLDTFSFQAPDFYKDFGYQVFGELADFPAGHKRYYMMKTL